jgi:hypothetical protein
MRWCLAPTSGARALSSWKEFVDGSLKYLALLRKKFLVTVGLRAAVPTGNCAEIELRTPPVTLTVAVKGAHLGNRKALEEAAKKVHARAAMSLGNGSRRDAHPRQREENCVLRRRMAPVAPVAPSRRLSAAPRSLGTAQDRESLPRTVPTALASHSWSNPAPQPHN